MEKIIVATGNQDKMREIREILAGFDIPILSMKEADLVTEVEETGETFEENALIKARAVWQKSGNLVISDDSGLEIDALNKEPGIHSSRYLGEKTSYHIKNQILVDRLEGVPKEQRTARFVCAAAIIFPDGSEKTVRGVMEGQIGYGEAGSNGFGYDPIFILPKYGQTTAELPPEIKNQESHRGQALRAVRDEIEAYRNRQDS
ncbi:MAG: RdgB/HAM1 family non-canonical purine NTP pyrophosphatase [Lachnospiraceae bacterium]|nr:RdgB/HAM1 family non-canonical purine NTP pyrophosphatase [Lachnospiraceae bacterium]